MLDYFSLKCVYANHTASYESLLNKARLPSLEVGRQMNITIQTFKILNDLAPTYLLELIEKRCRTRNLRNSKNNPKIPLRRRLRHGTNYFCFLAPKIWNSLPEALRITRDLKLSEMACKLIFLFIWEHNRGSSLDKIMWYIYLIINKCQMLHATFNHIFSFLIYSIIFSYIIFILLLCAKIYHVFFNQLIYILINIISIFLYIITLTHVFTFDVNFLPANLLVLVVIFIVSSPSTCES